MSSDEVFPAYFIDIDGVYEPTRGLTKRELFAGLAMQGILASPQLRASIDAGAIVRDAAKLADALIAALAKEPAK